jgi:hypothetical protein
LILAYVQQPSRPVRERDIYTQKERESEERAECCVCSEPVKSARGICDMCVCGDKAFGTSSSSGIATVTAEVEFLDIIGTKVLSVFLLVFHSHLY